MLEKKKSSVAMMSVRSVLSIVLVLASVSASCVEYVRYPIPETSSDQRYEYPRKLLELALSKTQTKYQIVYPPIPMNQERQVRELEAGRTIDVGPIPTSAEREARLLPIRIPLNKGFFIDSTVIVHSLQQNPDFQID